MMTESKSTVVIGASPEPSRYAYMAVTRLRTAGHPVYPLGKRKGMIQDIEIILEKPPLNHIHTVTLYVNPIKQKDWYDYILQLHPVRLIFNPGTENPEFEKMAQQAGIETVVACTLVLLSTHQY